MKQWQRLVSFAVGIAGIIYETVAVDNDRPYLLAVFMIMMGLPVAIGWDKKITIGQKDSEKNDN